MRHRPPLLTALALLALTVALAWWVTVWMRKGPTPPQGGLFFPIPLEIPVPTFAQADPRWGTESLGATTHSLAAEGCAVASAAMVLAAHGADIDPGRLNAFLAKQPGGYTPQGWIYWEKAAEYDPALTPTLLPHYENLPSHFLIDWNLLRGNPVIARLRYPNGISHFVVICGKRGFDYLIRDPGRGATKGIYPLRDFGSSIEAIRFYQPTQPTILSKIPNTYAP